MEGERLRKRVRRGRRATEARVPGRGRRDGGRESRRKVVEEAVQRGREGEKLRQRVRGKKSH